jgi:hypothetical protein
MNEESKTIFKMIGIQFNAIEDLDGLTIWREQLLSDTKYDEIKKLLPELKKIYSSSFMTSLQKNADKSQKWPLLNLVRQILNVYDYKMVPIRKADGYTLDGVKKYKRYFLIEKNDVKNVAKNDLNIKKIELRTDDDNVSITINN